MRTLHARMPIITSNSAELARRLLEHPNVVRSATRDLASHPDYEVLNELFQKDAVCWGSLSLVAMKVQWNSCPN